jgi:acyl carrier protein
MKIEDFIVAWVGKKLNSSIALDEVFFDNPDFDSLTFAQLIAALEEEFAVSVSFADLDDWSSVLTASGLSRFISKG